MLEEDSSKASFIEQLIKFEQESFSYWTTLNFEILAALVFQLEVYYKVDRLLTKDL